MIPFLKYRKLYFILSGTLILVGIISIAKFGLNFGIDFTGGSILEVEYQQNRPSISLIRDKLSDAGLGQVYIRPVGTKGISLRVKKKDISRETQEKVVEKLGELGKLQEKSKGFETISPVIGRELEQKTKAVIILSLLAIILYIAFAFRKISRPVSSWEYGIATIIALTHDVFIPIGVFSILGAFSGVQITIPIVTALLTIFGYSVNDTVVVFDRIREGLLKIPGGRFSYSEVVDKALNQTLVRSVNTSLTTLFVLFAIFFVGGETLHYFALALIIGIISGTYSSIFLASPLLVTWQQNRERKKGLTH